MGERTGVDRERLEKARRRIEKADLGAEEEFGKEKQEGNDRSFQKCFMLLFVLRYRAGDFRSAIVHYSSALQHKSRDAKVLSNRATAYYKLQMWLQCIKVLLTIAIQPHVASRIVTRAFLPIQLFSSLT